MASVSERPNTSSSLGGIDDDYIDESPTPKQTPHSSPILIPGENDAPVEHVGMGDEKKKKKSCRSNCINKDLLALKALLFIFYGGIGTVSTWLNHTLTSSRFSEKDTLLIYGLSSLLSLVAPIIFGLFSDKTGQPKKVLAVCLILGGLLYPLILTVPPADQPYKDRVELCNAGSNGLLEAGSNRNESGSLSSTSTPRASVSSFSAATCLPNRINCTSKLAELIADYGGCSEECNAKLIITKCRTECDDSLRPSKAHRNKNKDSGDIEYTDGPDAKEVSIDPARFESEEVEEEEDDENVESGSPSDNILALTPPHVCINDPKAKYKDLCYAFNENMHEVVLEANDISGYADYDGKCHYPLSVYSESKEAHQQLLSCSPLSSHCHVSCDLKWDSQEADQWNCHSDYLQWTISFASFVAIHTLGTMLVISAAGLLNSAILSMSHEHGGYFGCQYTYATLGFAIVTPVAAYVFQLIESWDIPWLVKHLEYLVGYSSWLILSAICVIALPYHAEWVPKPMTVRPMLLRWTFRGHTVVFFTLLVILGCFHGLIDVLAFYQIKSLPANILQIGLGATAAVSPALIFMFRVEKVIEYCGHQNIFGISLIVYSLQFTGYAYLNNTIPEWSFLLRAMDTFSVVMVWVTASYTTYTSAPRSLVATCQTVIVTLYCCIGRGIGGLVGYVGLHFIPKDLLLKIAAVFAIVVCVLYLLIHYCCLKPSPYTRQYDFDRSATLAPASRYTPLKLINGKKGKKGQSKGGDEFDDDDL